MQAMLPIHCTACGKPYPAEGMPYLCPDCGGVFDITGPIQLDPDQVSGEYPGLWKFWHSFGLKNYPSDVYMGEGNTALVWDEVDGRQIAYKLEYQNPTGSYKDRGTAVLVGHLLERGIASVVEDSSGNAGASLAGYAARCGIDARVFVPQSASGPKREQIVRYGAELIPIAGARSEAAKAVRKAADEGAAYASHAFLPFGLAGIATIAYELLEQTNGRCGSIIAPVGHGGLLLGIMKGFEAMRAAGVIEHMPYFIGVQSELCAPAYRSFTGVEALPPANARETIAEGIRVTEPVRAGALIRYLREMGGAMVAVEEEDILRNRNTLTRRGIYVEPTSAIVWSALKCFHKDLPEPAILVMTGSSYKYSIQ